MSLNDGIAWEKEYGENEYDKAIQTIKQNFNNSKGSISRKDSNYKPTKKEYEAIDYLFYEWDFEYIEKK